MRYGDETRPVRRPSHLTLVVVAALIAAACSGAPDGAGEILTVLHDQATVDGETVAPGDVIPASAVVATDAAGVARFRLSATGISCHMFQDAVVDLLDSDALLRFVRGQTFCTVAGDAGRQLRVETEDFDLTFGEARFGVDLTSDEPTVLVEQGRVRIDTFAGAERRQVASQVLSSDDDLPDVDGSGESPGGEADQRFDVVFARIRGNGDIEATEEDIDIRAGAPTAESSAVSAQELSVLEWGRETQMAELADPAQPVEGADSQADSGDSDPDGADEVEAPQPLASEAGDGTEEPTASEATGEGDAGSEAGDAAGDGHSDAESGGPADAQDGSVDAPGQAPGDVGDAPGGEGAAGQGAPPD